MDLADGTQDLYPMSKSKPDALLLRVMSAIHKTAETPAPGYRTVAEWATRWKMSRNSAWDNLEKGIKLGFIDKRIYRRAIRKDAKPYPMPHYGEKPRQRKT